MAVAVITVYKRIVINEIFVASVVRGVDIDYVYFALMGICKSRQCLKVITFYDYMVG